VARTGVIAWNQFNESVSAVNFKTKFIWNCRFDFGQKISGEMRKQKIRPNKMDF
jgi:hypothetical protein